MENLYISTVIPNGITLDRLFARLNSEYKFYSEPVGFKIENTSTDPTVQRIDKNGDNFNPEPDYFYNHELFIMPKVILSTNGEPVYGSDRIGTGLDFTGVNGNAMVWCNNCKYKYWYEADSDTQFYLYAPFNSNYSGFEYHPHCYSGGRLNEHFFIGAYEASVINDHGILKLTSCSGVQPLTGNTMKYFSFTNGKTQFSVGETLTNATTNSTGIVVATYVSSGDWNNETAAGVVYIRSPNGTFNTGQLNGSVSGENCATESTTASWLGFSLDNALTYASNVGTGWTIEDIYSTSLLQGLFYTQYGTRNSQTAIGSGITTCQVSVTTLYDGLMTGANNIDHSVNQYGTGAGNGVDGQTPIRWNNIENLWGNNLKFVAGINLFYTGGTDGDGNSYAAGSYRLTKPDGTGAISAVLPAESYITGEGTVPTSPPDGYISTVQRDKFGAITFLPSTYGNTGSSSATSYCDTYSPATHNPSIMLSSGYWGIGYPSIGVQNAAGIGYKYATLSPTGSYRYIGARLKYIPQS